MTGAGGRVTVLLATYNGAAFLPAFLASLEGQAHRDWALLWRDDGSTDATAELMAGLAGRLGAQRVAQVTDAAGRQGVLGNFLSLLRAAVPQLGPHDLVAFADQDDVWLPPKLSRGVAALAALHREQPSLYCARQLLVNSALQPIGLSEPVTVTPGFPAALAQNVAAGCTVMLNRAAAGLIANSQPPATTVHDWWSYILVAAAGGTIIADPEPTILYRQHGGNAIGARASRLRRAIAAARRGPGPFMSAFAGHVASLSAQPEVLSPAARRDLAVLRAAIDGGRRARLAALRLPGLRRNHWSEGLLFRLWFLIG